MPVTHIKSKWIVGDLHFTPKVAGLDPQIVFGVDDTGLDVKFFGATSGSYMLWDQSEDHLDLEEATIQVGARASGGDGVTIVATDGGQQRALLVCVDDGGVALSTGWCQAILGSTEVYTAISTGNPSIFGTSGELWINHNVTSTGNLAGLQGAVVLKTGKTLTAGKAFGVTLGCVFVSGAVLHSTSFTGGVLIGGHYEGTMDGKIVGIFFENPTGATQYDYAFKFGQDTKYAGMIASGAVGGSQTHKVKVQMGTTDMFIALSTA